jgi:hypothetical protein
MACAAVALAAGAVLAPAALAVGERLIVDGCDVGSGGNDIHSVESRYDADRNEIVVALRLCNDVQSDATYRVHLDHAAPFVEEAEKPASCKTPADSVVARTPDGHQGVGASEVTGNLVSFVVPLDDLDVGEPEEVPLIPLWATSRLGGTVDRAPNRETGDRCAHPQARTETLVHPRVEINNLVWIGSWTLDGFLGPDAGSAISFATTTCRQDAQSAGISNTDGIIVWLSTGADDPRSHIPNPEAVGPIRTADGTTVAVTMADLLNCDLSRVPCQLAPMHVDIHGHLVDQDTLTWTGTRPDGRLASGANCNDWTSSSGDISGEGGDADELGTGWTTGSPGTCDEVRQLICFQLEGAD